MKQQIKTWMIAVSSMIVVASSYAQSPTSTPRWVSDKGYWVAESNVQTPLQHCIRFYTNEDVLVYTENLSGVKLNPAKRKVRMKLKKVLEASVIAWQEHKKPEADKEYVAAILK